MRNEGCAFPNPLFNGNRFNGVHFLGLFLQPMDSLRTDIGHLALHKMLTSPLVSPCSSPESSLPPRPFSQAVEVEFDDISAKARMGSGMTLQLTKLFASSSAHRFEDRFLRATRNRKRNTARSTTHVLDLGVIDSPLCFSTAKFRKERKCWITPNGWRTATHASDLLFVGECQVRDGEMKYRFSVMRGLAAPVPGVWSANLQNAFTSLFEADATLESETNWNKVSKEVLLAVHCDLVQNSLMGFWEACKLRLSKPELAVALGFERQSFVKRPKLAPRPATATSAASLLASSQMLSPAQLVELFTLINHGCRVPEHAVTQLLYLLEAGNGAKIDLVLHFLALCEDAARIVFANQHQHSLEDLLALMFGKPLDLRDGAGQPVRAATWLAEFTRTQQQQPSSLEFRAVLLVFDRMRVLFQTRQALAQETELGGFLKRVLVLPDASTSRKRLREMI